MSTGAKTFCKKAIHADMGLVFFLVLRFAQLFLELISVKSKSM